MTSLAIASDPPSAPEAPPRRTGGGADALPVFAAEAGAADGLDRAPAAGLLAEVALHRRAETPIALGVFGPAGSGKTAFLRAMLDAAARLAAAAGGAAGQSPFVGRVATARIEARPGLEPSALLVGGLLDALAIHHAALAEDAVHAGGDPREAARVAGERLNALRRSLDDERQALDDIGIRRARLTETVLFDGAGSRVDGFARANRGRIEARLRAFGLPTADPLRTFKELVRDGADPSGGGSRLGLTLRALWGYKGQGALLAVAVLCAALGWAAGAGAADPSALSDWLAGFGDRFTALAEAARAHLDLLQPVSRIAFALAALALLADLVRAGRFLGPIYRGITLLKGDLAARRRDLDGLLAHQTRRVDGLAAEAEAAGRGAEVAQRRADGGRGTGLSDHGAALARDLFGLSRTAAAAAESFFGRLSERLVEGGEDVPERILVAVDGLDRLPASEAATFLADTHRLLAKPGFVLVMALERDTMATALGEFDPAAAAARLDRSLQLSYDLGAAPADAAGLAARLLDPRSVASRPAAALDASRSTLDRPMEPFEAPLMQRLAPFTGGTPRAVKRFVNAYRVARADPRLVRATPGTLAVLALGLALDGTGAGSEIAAFEGDVGRGRVTMDQGSDVGRAYAAALSDIGSDVPAADIRRGLAVARSFGRRG